MKLIENALGLGFGRCVRFLCVDGDEDVAGLHLRFHLIVGQVLLIVLLDLGVGNGRGGLRQIGDGEGNVLDLARLGDGVSILGGVLLEPGLKLRVRGIDLVAEIGPRR